MQEEITYPEYANLMKLVYKWFFFSFFLGLMFIVYLWLDFDFTLEKFILMWAHVFSLIDKIKFLILPFWMPFLTTPLIYWEVKKMLVASSLLIKIDQEGVTYQQGKFSRVVSWKDYRGIEVTFLPGKTKWPLFLSGGKLVVLDVFDKDYLNLKVESFRQKMSI